MGTISIYFVATHQCIMGTFRRLWQMYHPIIRLAQHLQAPFLLPRFPKLEITTLISESCIQT
jgi:hypothetical protein